jgi:hypothetical protein
MRLWQMLAGIYYQPEKVFSGLKEKPQWLVPLLLVLVLSAAAVLITRPVVLPEMMSEISKNHGIPPEQLETIQQRLQNPWLGLINPLAGSGLAMLITALVFWGLFAMLGGRTSFKLMFTAVTWSWMARIPELALKVPLMLVQETVRVHTSLALVLPEEMERTFIYRLCSQVDIFNIWTVALLALGCSLFSGVERKKAYGASFAAWGLWAVVLSALTGLIRPGG